MHICHKLCHFGHFGQTGVWHLLFTAPPSELMLIQFQLYPEEWLSFGEFDLQLYRIFIAEVIGKTKHVKLCFEKFLVVWHCLFGLNMCDFEHRIYQCWSRLGLDLPDNDQTVPQDRMAWGQQAITWTHVCWWLIGSCGTLLGVVSLYRSKLLQIWIEHCHILSGFMDNNTDQ